MRAGRDGLLELREIARHDDRIEAQLVAAEEDFLVDLTAQRIEKLLQRVAGLLGGTLGPEASQQLVAPNPSLSGCGQQRQEREPEPLGYQRVAVGIGQSQPAKGR